MVPSGMGLALWVVAQLQCDGAGHTCIHLGTGDGRLRARCALHIGAIAVELLHRTIIQAGGREVSCIAASDAAWPSMMDKANDLVARGADRHRSGRLAEAESLYRRALRLNADHPDALNLLGLAMRSRGALAEGLALSARAMALAPDKPLILANYGAGLAEAGQLDQAIAVMQAALARAPADAVTWRNLGQALAAKGEARAALEPLLTAARA